MVGNSGQNGISHLRWVSSTIRLSPKSSPIALPIKPSKLSRWLWRDWCVILPLCPHSVPSLSSITRGGLISLLFCHANYSKRLKRPPCVLNDGESIERGQMEGGIESQPLCAAWHLNCISGTLRQQLHSPYRLPARIFFFSFVIVHHIWAINRSSNLAKLKAVCRQRSEVCCVSGLHRDII